MSIDEFISNAEKSVAKAKKLLTNPLESTHEKAFEKWCKAKGVWSVKLVFFVGSGWPDRTLFAPGGRICFVELKRNKTDSTISPAQKYVRRKLKALGFKYFVGYGADDAIKKVGKWL